MHKHIAANQSFSLKMENFYHKSRKAHFKKLEIILIISCHYHRYQHLSTFVNIYEDYKCN